MWLNKTNRVGLWVVKEGGWVMVCTTKGEIEWAYLQRVVESCVASNRVEAFRRNGGSGM
jgi:hypothetical protein